MSEKESSLSVSTSKSSGSSTGSLRNKCALKPGHSLHDWIRLGNSGIDLAGTHGKVVPVSKKELSQHNNSVDAWIAIRGKVYNVTQYMEFHPGGVEELMRGAGKDATKLFESVHPWVNYEQLLAKCFVGPIVSPIVKENINFKLATTFIEQPQRQQQQSSEITPRFDWIQKSSDISLTFYTKAYCNPGLILQSKSNKEFCFRILFESYSFVYNFELQFEVNWPPNLAKIVSESGKIDVRFTKTIAALWNSYGTHTSMKSEDLEDLNFVFEVCEKRVINHDSFAISLTSVEKIIILPPIGYHFSITANINGTTMIRSYTSVPMQFSTLTGLRPSLHFLIKTYRDGQMTKHLEKSEISMKFELSLPEGTFKLSKISDCDCVVLLAAGSGLTPMLSLIEHILMRSSKKVGKTILLLFNKTEKDIWCGQELKQMCSNQFQLINVLSQPTPDWIGETGHINKNLIMQILKDVSIHRTFTCICGPLRFNKSAEEILASVEFPSDNIYVFQ